MTPKIINSDNLPGITGETFKIEIKEEWFPRHITWEDEHGKYSAWDMSSTDPVTGRRIVAWTGDGGMELFWKAVREQAKKDYEENITKK